MARVPSTAPIPHTRRWQPLRAGLVDLFYDDVEEFHFHDGRLLLRATTAPASRRSWR
ncbi:hypothetical protein [Actinokineospora sp.]|uniref:hypothetical protein n=1 Tax=Actinokineospora sp. TaxID=1872133 RepID=UPI003D6C2C80